MPIAGRQFEEAPEIVSALEEASREFSTLVQGRTIEYQLIDDLCGFPLFSLGDGVSRITRRRAFTGPLGATSVIED